MLGSPADDYGLVTLDMTAIGLREINVAGTPRRNSMIGFVRKFYCGHGVPSGEA